MFQADVSGGLAIMVLKFEIVFLVMKYHLHPAWFSDDGRGCFMKHHLSSWFFEGNGICKTTP